MTATASDLSRKHCQPCEGGVPALSATRSATCCRAHRVAAASDGKRIRREWRQDFVTALDFFRRVGELAQAEITTRTCT